jgi:hypothetical protein
MDANRPRIEAAFKEMHPGVYDTRDLNAIQNWAKELAQKVHSCENPQNQPRPVDD